MTSSINTFNFPKDMNLTIIKNSSKLSSYEQKNLAILILVTQLSHIKKSSISYV